jgi:hemerythrin-like domain-containing protein
MFIDKAVDFIRIYADRTHHGKEEDILFRDLALKELAPEHDQIMHELLEEHKWARATTGQIVGAKNRYVDGDTSAVDEMADLLEKLTEFYPIHIAKEDQHFFVPVMKYFSEEELAAMLAEMWEFDRQLIHEKYKKVVEEFEEA